MDYTNFVRTYYRIAINKLEQYSQYNGSIVDFDYVLDIPNDKKHEVRRESMFLPDYDLNINAETAYFEKFLEYYGYLYADLGAILLDKQKLIELYNVLIVGTDEEAIVAAISVYIDTGTKYLEETGVLL